MSPHELAQRAREKAVHTYLAHCDALTDQGDALYAIDASGAVACWLDAMKALDMAKVAAIGLEPADKEF